MSTILIVKQVFNLFTRREMQVFILHFNIITAPSERYITNHVRKRME